MKKLLALALCAALAACCCACGGGGQSPSASLPASGNVSVPSSIPEPSPAPAGSQGAVPSQQPTGPELPVTGGSSSDSLDWSNLDAAMGTGFTASGTVTECDLLYGNTYVVSVTSLGDESHLFVVNYTGGSGFQTGDVVDFSGTVTNWQHGEKLVGGSVTTVTCDSTSMVAHGSAPVEAPAVQPEPAELPESSDSISVTQGSVTITMTDIALSGSDTVAYLTIANNGSDRFNLVPLDCAISQSGQTLGHTNNEYLYGDGLSGEVAAGSSLSGVMTFEGVDPYNGFSVVLQGFDYATNQHVTFNFNIDGN